MKVTLPPVVEQRAIASVLAALDDKIESNRRVIIEAVRAVARALYDSAVGADPRVAELSDVVEFHNKRRIPLSAAQRREMRGAVPYYGATGVFDYVDRALFDDVLLLVGEDGSVMKDDGAPVTQYIWGGAWVNNHAHVLTGRGISTELALLAIERADVSAWITGAVQPKLSMRNLRRLSIRIPVGSACSLLEAAIEPLFESTRTLTDESQTLAAIRDALLPKLVSGQIRVSLTSDDEIATESVLVAASESAPTRLISALDRRFRPTRLRTSVRKRADKGYAMTESMSIERLESEILALAAHIHASTCRWLDLVAEYDRREGWVANGAKSCAHWISFMCGVGPGAAREHVRVARALEPLPLVHASFERGELSYSKVRALTRLENVEDEAALLRLARAASASQLEQLLRSHRSCSAIARGAERAHEERFLSWYHDDDGALIFQGRLPAEEGAVVVATIEAARERFEPKDVPAGTSRPPEDVPAETSPPAAAELSRREPVGARRADALVVLADSLLPRGAADRSCGDRHQVVVHVDADALADRESRHGGEIEHGPPLLAETARRLCCDASIVAIVERAGKPLSVGRKTRSIPPSIRRALRSRDGCCRFPGCHQTQGVHAHHIEHWAHGGETRLTNLVQLCGYHHRLVHEGGFSVERSRGNAFTFRRPDGRRVTAMPRLPRGSHAYIVDAAARRGIAIGEDTCRPTDGGRMDPGLCADAMLRIAPPVTEAPGI